METMRNVLVYKDNGDSKLKFQTSAKEFGEILDVIKSKFSMSDSEVAKYEFIDGIHRTRYAANSVLPEKSIHPRTGKETTDLSIFMVRTKKNTESGSTPKKMVDVNRKEIVACINTNKFNNDILITFGKNLTQVSTDNLFVYLYVKDINLFGIQFKVKDQSLLNKCVEDAKSNWACFNNEVPAKRELRNNCTTVNHEDEKPENAKDEQRNDESNGGSKEIQENDSTKEEGNDAVHAQEETAGDFKAEGIGAFTDSQLENEIIRRYIGRADDANKFINRFSTEVMPESITDEDMRDMMNRI